MNTKRPTTDFFFSFFPLHSFFLSAMCQDDWIKSALSDDSLVAEFLIGLRIPKRRLLEWGVRQPRSRQVVRFSGVDDESKKKGGLTRDSPTTPLSWSAGTSNSGDGCEESSVRLTNTRSKAITPSENNTRRSRKKTFAQLKDHENFLLNQGINLKRALATEHILYEREKIKCESLKRLKFDLQSQSPCRQAMSATKQPTMHQSYLVDAMASEQPTVFLPPSEKCRDVEAVFPGSAEFSNAQKKESVQRECHRVLPDLNLLPDLNIPFEEELN